MVADAGNGHLYAVWVEEIGHRSRVQLSSSSNWGTTWGTPKLVAGPMSLKGLPSTTLGYMVGDYMSTSFGSNGKAYPVLANALGSSCTLGQITSCKEAMFTATNGLAITGGSRRATTGPVLFRGSGSFSLAGKTAF